MKRTNVQLQLPFEICDRCAELDVSARLSSVGHYGWTYQDDIMGTATRDIIITCKNHEVCERLYRMIYTQLTQSQIGGDNNDKKLD